MSTKGSIFLTEDNEHCYDETFEEDNGKFRVYLEIDPKNIKSVSYDECDGLIIGIRGDSQIAQVLRTCRDIQDEKEKKNGNIKSINSLEDLREFLKKNNK